MTLNTAHSLSSHTLPNLDGLDVRGKRVLLRVDFNVGLTPDGDLRDDYRIVATLPTLKRLLQDGARVGILTHFGRPGGRVLPHLSTHPLSLRLSELLGQAVPHVPDCIGRMAEHAIDQLAPGQVLMFENTRFHLGEQLNQAPFVQQLTRLGDIFVNDAFATAHRAHGSTSGLAAAMPVSVIGDLMRRELEWLERLTHQPKRPLLLILGGSSVDVKIDLLQHLIGHTETVMLGGAVANTFMAARDLGMGQSLLSPPHVDTARELLTEAGVVGCRMHIPQDVWVHEASVTDGTAEIKPCYAVGGNEAIVDIGPQTLATWKRLAADAGTTVFIGSLGAMENPAGRDGSLTILNALAENANFSLVAGDGMFPLIRQHNLRDMLPALSTAGAPPLVDYLCGRGLPCLLALRA